VASGHRGFGFGHSVAVEFEAMRKSRLAESDAPSVTSFELNGSCALRGKIRAGTKSLTKSKEFVQYRALNRRLSGLAEEKPVSGPHRSGQIRVVRFDAVKKKI